MIKSRLEGPMQNMQGHGYQGAQSLDPNEAAQFQAEMRRLHQLTVYGRWLFVSGVWLTVGGLSLWQLRFRIQLLMDYFTWSAVRYGLAYHQWAALGLALCLGMTAAVLTWQSRNWLFGLSQIERIRLQHQVQRIRQQGVTHPLWRWIHKEP
jgi:hypothetical protein